MLRILALFLSGALAAPAPAYALRPVNAGAEESPTQSRLVERLILSSAEEQFLHELQEKWPAITLRGRPPSDPLTKRLLLLVSVSGAQLQRLYPGQVGESRIARVTRGNAVLLIEVREGWIGPWQGKEETLWAHNANWQWPWIEEHLAPKRRKILLEGRDPLERIPLYRQVYEWFQKELGFPTKLTQADRDGLETASFYIAKLGITALESAKEVIKVYTQAVPDLDLKKPEERLQFLIATYAIAMNKGVEALKEVIKVYTQAVPDLDLKKPEERLQFLIATWQKAVEKTGSTVSAGIEETQIEVAVHDHLLNVVRAKFGNLPNLTWKPLSTNVEAAEEQLKDFVTQDGVRRIVILDGLYVSSEWQVNSILPEGHAPAFIVDASVIGQLTPETIARLLQLPEVSAGGIYFLRFEKNRIRLEIQA